MSNSAAKRSNGLRATREDESARDQAARGADVPGETAQREGGLAETALIRLGMDQQTALELLVTGKTISETARAAGVSRTTIYQWLRHDPGFQAAYNQWHDQLEVSCQSRLLMLTDKATDAIEKAMENGDARSALQLLKGMGMIRQREIGPTDAEEMKGEMELEKKRKSAKRRSDELYSEFG